MKKLIVGLTVGMLIGSATVALASPSTVQATLQKYRIVINGKTQSSTTNQLSYKGTTYVPIREAAKLFHYTTNYNSKANSIEFTSNIGKDEWITLLDLQALSKISISPLADKEGAYEITRAGQSLFIIYGGEFKDGDSTLMSDANNKQFHVKKTLGTLLFNKQDMKNAGYIVF
ncbi:stalk domain-containing protein [Paenibacillus sp. Y412MC10]|uniref:stalk domain-containing protein n=1 Tax=Geobacillus sp. (strain Y412MC10) TaxID=481743 RepID=UPI0016424181|nr:stalk domain-containing protein [Paenibacillus sp. Y412MC10]